jgi:hypothetical protein
MEASSCRCLIGTYSSAVGTLQTPFAPNQDAKVAMAFTHRACRGGESRLCTVR